MLPTSTRAPRTHQVVLSLTPRCLRIVHLRRGLVGWRCAHEENLPTPEHHDELSAIAAALAERLQRWAVPQGCHAYWVVTGDILGVAAPPPGGGAAALPFPASDVRTHADAFGDKAAGTLPAPLLWVHKDWVAELERISTQCGLQLIEIFARGQLFQRAVGTSQRALRAVLEREGDENFLHIYATTGKLLRTRMLERDALSAPQTLQALLKIEALAFGTGAMLPELEVLDAGGLLGGPLEGFTTSKLSPVSPRASLMALWRSSIEGIAIRAVHPAAVRDLVLGSAAVAAAGLVIVGGFAWHDGQLQEEIAAANASIKRQQPRVDIALAQRAQTLRMADAVQATDSTQKHPDAFDSFQRALSVFPPAPATLHYLRATPELIELTASGGEAAAQWLAKTPAPEFGPFAEFTPPADLMQPLPDIRLQARRSPAAQQSPSPAEPSASQPKP